jgi:hypothetical protein
MEKIQAFVGNYIDRKIIRRDQWRYVPAFLFCLVVVWALISILQQWNSGVCHHRGMVEVCVYPPLAWPNAIVCFICGVILAPIIFPFWPSIKRYFEQKDPTTIIRQGDARKSEIESELERVQARIVALETELKLSIKANAELLNLVKWYQWMEENLPAA